MSDDLMRAPPARKEAPAEGAGDAWKPLYDRHGYLNDPEGLARIRSGLLEVKDWHDLPGAIVNCNSLARLLDTIDALRSRTSEPEAGAAAWNVTLAPDTDPDWPEARELDSKVFYVLRPDGRKLGVVAADEDDARSTIRELHPAPATADKLKVAVEALEKIANKKHISSIGVARLALAALNEQPQ